jgi:flagellar hook protein FlgE
MLSSFFSGISGLLANSNAINVVSNNIANVNTIGFKGSTANFQDVLYQSISGASGSSQVGRGTALSSVDTNFSAGSLETTTQGTDLAIGGKGFFIVRSSESENIYYTRAGNFTFDSDGNLTDPNGNILQGREIDRTTNTPQGVDGDITISQAPSEPRATTAMDMNVNLQSDADWAGDIGSLVTTTAPAVGSPAVGAATVSSGEYPAVGTYTLDYNATAIAGPPAYQGTLTITCAAGTSSIGVNSGQTLTNFGGFGLDVTVGTLPATASVQTVTLTGFDANDPVGTSNYTSPITAYDSLGQPHIVSVYFRKTSEASGLSTWSWYAEPAAGELATGAPLIQGQGTLTFNSSGVLTGGNGEQPVEFDFSGNCLQDQMINLDFGSGTGGGTTTQYPISSTTNYSTQDGYPPGVLQNISVSAEGTISGTYSNGQILDLYQVTLANFNNPNGLYKEGSNLFSETLASGVAYTNSPGEGGLGKISANSLEQSNVDLATEFVRMIIAQRGFQANSKVITTTDEILQELMTLKR